MTEIIFVCVSCRNNLYPHEIDNFTFLSLSLIRLIDCGVSRLVFTKTCMLLPHFKMFVKFAAQNVRAQGVARNPHGI